MVVPCLLAREMDVALECETLLLSFIVVVVTRPQIPWDPTEGGIEQSGSTYGAFWRMVGGPGGRVAA
jgi:hypothetical protein